MSATQRSPFGELIRTLRRSRHWSQDQLSNATEGSPRSKRIAKRTIADYEARMATPADWVVPGASSVDAIAWAFTYPLQSDGHRDLVAAALETERIKHQSLNTSTQAPSHTRIEAPPIAVLSAPVDTPFVAAGRESHLNHIAAAVQQAAAGQPGMLFVQAEAGSGKSTLIIEACRRALTMVPDLVVFWGNCTGRLGVADPYQPFRHIFRTMLGDTRVANPRHLINQTNCNRIVERLPSAIRAMHNHGKPLRHRLVPTAVFETPAVRAVGDSQIRRYVESLRTESTGQITGEPNLALFNVLHAYTHRVPTILVIEDLHWTDPGTADVLTRYISHLRAHPAPILIIGSFRPADILLSPAGEHHPATRLLHQAAIDFPHTIVNLATALAPKPGKAYIRGVCANRAIPMTDEECDAIYQRTGGLPYVLEGLIQLHGNALGQVCMAANTVPDNVHDIFQGQIELLDDQQRQVLKIASVQGNTFSAEILRWAVGMSSDACDALLYKLEFDLNFIQRAGMSPITDQEVREYQFSHALLRDDIYFHQMSDLERSHAHLLTAEALVAVYGDVPGDATAVLALHLEQAGEIGAAAKAWIAAGNHAHDTGQFDRAWQAYDVVHSHGSDLDMPDLETEALIGLGNTARSLDRSAEAATWLTRAVNMATRRGFVSARARATSTLGMLAYHAGNMHHGTEMLQEAIELHLQVNDREEASRSLARLSYNLHGMGYYDGAAYQAKRSIDLAKQIENIPLLVGANIGLANCWLDIGRFDKALPLYEEGVILGSSIPDSHRVNICLLNISQTHFDQEQWDLAEGALTRLLQPGRSVVPRYIGVAEFQLGIIREGQQRHEEAAKHYQHAYEIRAQNGQEALLIDTLGGLLRIATTFGHRNEVIRLSDRLDQAIAHHGLDGIEHVGRLCLSLVEAATFLEDPEIAQRHLAWGHEFVITRANRLTNPDHRASYLTNVRAHRRIMTRATNAPPQ